MEGKEVKEIKELKLHLGCGKHPLEGWVNLDQIALEGVDVVFDLNDCKNKPLPFEDNSVDYIFASHVLEHIQDTLSLMEELYRVTKPGGEAVFRMPYGSSDDAYENPTHVRPYFLNSFGYFSQPFYWREDYGYKGDWKTKVIILILDKAPYEQMPYNKIMEEIYHKRNVVHEMVAILEPIKPIREALKDLQENPHIQFVFE